MKNEELFTSIGEITDKGEKVFNEIWEDFWDNRKDVYALLAKTPGGDKGKLKVLEQSDYAKELQQK